MNPPASIGILIVDDHPLLRSGLTSLLERQRDFQIVGQAATGEEALGLADKCPADVCLLDLNLPGIGGLETLRRLLALRPSLKVLILTSSESPEDAARALRAGACGFVSKNTPHDVVIATIRDAHRGKTGMLRGVAARATARRGPLTSREMDVLRLIRKGRSNLEIARDFNISTRTVKGHVTVILEKLAAADRAEAVARGFELGLFKPGDGSA